MRISDWSSDVCSSDLPEQPGVLAVPADDAAVRIPRAAAGGAALVLAVHRLGGEVVAEVTGIADRPVVAAGAIVAVAGLVPQHRVVPVVEIAAGLRLGLDRDRQPFHPMVVGAQLGKAS